MGTCSKRPQTLAQELQVLSTSVLTMVHTPGVGPAGSSPARGTLPSTPCDTWTQRLKARTLLNSQLPSTLPCACQVPLLPTGWKVLLIYYPL